jgi:predicted transposase YbfD/YdcC
LLSKIKDKRNASGKRHELIHILVIVILGTMSGYEGYRGIEAFIERFESELIDLLKTGREEAPSLSTVRRVLIGIDFNQLSWAFYKWIKPRVKIKQREWINCDGKGIKGTMTDYEQKYQNFVSIVSMYCSRSGVVLSAQAMNNRDKSEIEVLRELIASLDITGVIITADAIHCQKKTLSLIISKENDYVVKVKKNQKVLLEKMIATVNKENAIDRNIVKEKNRGREEKRLVKVYTAPRSIKKDWPSARSIVYVQRTTLRKGKETITDSFYLSSLKLRAKQMAAGIRSHWRIENELHYVKDVVTHEDDIKIKEPNAAAVFAIIRNEMLNIFRLNGCSSIKSAIRYYGGNLTFLMSLLE